ncbi:MAG: hypothetical protein KH702_10595 [Ruminococcus bicirculans]|nr:hypothetical protein [Ruminococcus bicirculans (ex Wegman et al. 2014)]
MMRRSSTPKSTNNKVSGKGFSKRKAHKKAVEDQSSIMSRLSFESIENGIVTLKVKGKSIKMGVLAVSGMDIFDLNDYDRNTVFNNFAKATLSIGTDHKYVFTSKTPYLANQKAYIKYKMQKSINRYSEYLLNEQHDMFEDFEVSHYDRMAYLFIYSDDEKKIYTGAQRFINHMRDVDVSWCSTEEIIVTLNKLICLNTENQQLSENGDLNETILPETIIFKPNYYKINDVFAQTVVVYDYAAEIDDLRLAQIVTQSNDTIVWDVNVADKETVLDELSSSLRELESRGGIIQDATEKLDTSTEYQKLEMIYQNIKNGNEQIYYVTLRFIVSDTDLNSLSKRTKELIHELELSGLTAYVPTNIMQHEFLTTIDKSNMIKTPFPVFDTLSRQFPFYYQSHIDDTGLFFGYTETGGLNILNTFKRTKSRNSFDLLAIGLKGGGKSVTLKSMLEDQLLIGNKVMVLDPKQFPSFTDVNNKLHEKLCNRTGMPERKYEAYSNIQVYIKQLCGKGAYAGMFDGATNVDVKSNNLIIFDVKSISEMAENVYNAQLFNILTIMWSTICKNIGYNQNLINPWDKRNVVCLIDEAHRFISVKYPQVTEFIEKLVRRTRKYFAGLWFATQSILDFIPDGNITAAGSIKVIFSLVQYRLVLKQSPESIEILHQAFPQFSYAELKESTAFEPGQMLLSLGAGRDKLHCRRIVGARQLLYMGNAEDRIEIIHNCFSHYYNEYSKQEYGLMLRKMDADYFRKCFLAETYSYLRMEQNISHYIDAVIVQMVDNLIKELLQAAGTEAAR